MSAVAVVLPEPSTATRGKNRGGGLRLENLALSLVLATMVLIPLTEALLRRTLHIGIPASTALVQHAFLLVGM